MERKSGYEERCDEEICNAHPGGQVFMKKELRVIVHPLGRVITVAKGTNLLDAIREAGLQMESICGGKGECRKCRVVVERGGFAERARQGAKQGKDRDLIQDYHLACEISVIGDLEVTIPVESRIENPQILMETGIRGGGVNPSVSIYPLQVSSGKIPPFTSPTIRLSGYSGPRPRIDDAVYAKILASDPPLHAMLTRTNRYPEIIDILQGELVAGGYGLALDIGTTTLVGVLVDLSSGKVISRAATLNRQITYGEELITRIAYSGRADGLQVLQKLAIESINRLVRELAGEAGIRTREIADVCISGNTVMAHLLTGTDSAYLEMVDAKVPRAPYIGRAGSLGMEVHESAYCYILPNVSRFVGGDAVGDVMVSGLATGPEFSLLIDLGTNGEIIAGNHEWLASVSCASGPAFEGAGISSGMRAMRGAIEHVRIDPGHGVAEISVIGDVLPRGICGSGLIDAAAHMFRAGILDFKGRILASHQMVRQGFEGPAYLLVPGNETATGRDIMITQRDMDYLMDSKAALCGAIGVLMKKFRLNVADIRHVYLAGAFGAFTDMQSAISFGIIPAFPNAEIRGIGNGSLSGAYETLVSMNKRKEAERIAEMMIYIDLLVDTDFIEEYTAALCIPGKQEYFPFANVRSH